MDDKLTLISDLTEEIKQTKKSKCLPEEKAFQANILIDDVIQKLVYLRNMCSNASLNTENQRYYDEFLLKKGIRQRLSHRGSLRGAQMINVKTEAVLNNDSADLAKVARNAYENENYAKCVRTVERIATLQESTLSSTLMDLCHNSYKKVIQSAPTDTDRLKLCEWWRLFIESTSLDDCSNESLLRQIDWRSECLQERLKLARCITERLSVSEMLIVGLIEAYEVAAQSVVPFSVVKLKERIDGLCSMISDHLSSFSEVNKISLVVEEGIEVLRLIYSEANDEFNALKTSHIKNDKNEEILMGIISEIKFVLRRCSWSDVSSRSVSELSSPCSTPRDRNTTSIPEQSSTITQELSSPGDPSHDDTIMDAHF